MLSRGGAEAIRGSQLSGDIASIAAASPSAIRGTAKRDIFAVSVRAVAIFAPLMTAVAVVLLLLYRAQYEAVVSLAVAREQARVDIVRQEIVGNLRDVMAHVRYLSEQKTLRYWLANGDSITRSILEQNYLAFVGSMGFYDQARFVDENGRERVRVDWDRGTPRVVPESELQNKADRYYVPATLALARGQIYVSPFDLNVERGAIEQPIKPIIRVAAPVFDDRGQKRGLVILNYLGEKLRDAIRALAPERRISLLNGDGYWMLGPSAADEWAFMYPERAARTLARTSPEAWTRIKAGAGSGQFWIAGAALTFAKVPPRGTDTSPWIVLSVLSAEELSGLGVGMRANLLLVFAGFGVVFAGSSWAVAALWEARRRAERVVRANETRFRTLLESAPDAVIVTDSGGRILIANAQAESLFGYRRDELIGRPIEMLVPQRLREAHVRHREAYVGAPRPRAMGSGLDLLGRRKDASEVPIAVSLSPATTDEGAVIFCDIRDISEQRRAEEHVRTLNAQLARDNTALQAVNKELEAFSYSVSHDLRTPLRAIDGFSQALVEDYGDRLDDAGKDYAARVRGAAQRMGLLIDDLLKLARVTRADLEPDTVDLSSIADDIAASCVRSAPGRAATFSIAPNLSARGDARLLRIVLENLLANAWKFTAGNAAARIEFGARAHDGGIAYFVRDNGVGFDMAHAGKLFGAFQRLHDAREYPGTGIGLATVQRIVHRHGGRVWAESEVGKGTTFYFTL